jgi:hypothetical protein
LLTTKAVLVNDVVLKEILRFIYRAHLTGFTNKELVVSLPDKAVLTVTIDINKKISLKLVSGE